MKLRIRSKFIGILVLASAIPLGLALAAFQWFGERYYRTSCGQAFQDTALHLSQLASQSVCWEAEVLSQWVWFNQIAPPHIETNASAVDAAKIQEIEARWPTLTNQSPELTLLLDCELARRLREFIGHNPNFAELLVTDAAGRLVAATRKTTDYWQADEAWWSRAKEAGPNSLYIEAINFDQSAGVYSVDLCMPLYDQEKPDGPVAGVLKAVLDASPVFKPLLSAHVAQHTEREVVLENGGRLVRLNGGKLGGAPIGPEAEAVLRSGGAGWARVKLAGDTPSLMGYAPLQFSPQAGQQPITTAPHPAWVLVHRPDSAVMEPVRRPMQLITAAGVGLVALSIMAGFLIASRHIIGPIDRLRRAAGAVAQSVRLEEGPRDRSSAFPGAAREPARLLDQVNNIRTRDEIEDLAREFAFMSRRVLSYQEKLESEIAETTAEIRRDLEFAREFQANLMPRKYPDMSACNRSHGIGLNFHHIYKPASTLGGDFFNVLKLGDDRAGIFIADVMGHGARSALVTAILATLLQDLERSAGSPAEFLRRLNEHFYKIAHNAGDVVFVSAFYLLLDINALTATFASAGHPSPLFIDRSTRRVEELLPHLTDNPALGLFPASTYHVAERPVKEGDVFLLFTDGLYECSDPSGNEFGRLRLLDLVAQNCTAPLPVLTQTVADAVFAFAGPEGMQDDVCMVAVEVGSCPSRERHANIEIAGAATI